MRRRTGGKNKPNNNKTKQKNTLQAAAVVCGTSSIRRVPPTIQHQHSVWYLATLSAVSFLFSPNRGPLPKRVRTKTSKTGSLVIHRRNKTCFLVIIRTTRENSKLIK